MRTVTVASSPGAFPAVPESVGVASVIEPLGEVTVGAGAVTSYVNDALAGVAWTLPAASTARASTVYATPSVSRTRASASVQELVPAAAFQTEVDCHSPVPAFQ